MARDMIKIGDEIDRMRDRMDRMMDSIFGEGLPLRGGIGQKTPSVDMYETENEVKASIELPGLNKEDIKLEVRNGVLNVKGEKGDKQEDNKEGYYYMERSYTSFARSIPLPVEVDEDNVVAKYNNGVLDVTLPKKNKGENVKYIDIE